MTWSYCLHRRYNTACPGGKTAFWRMSLRSTVNLSIQWTVKTYVSKTPYCRGECKAVYQAPAPHNTCGSCCLGTAQQFYQDMHGERKSRVTSKIKQGAHIHQPTAWPLPHACAQPYHADSGRHLQLFRSYWGSSAWHSRRSVTGDYRV